MLVERDSELALLDDALDELESAGGKVVLIRGEAGVGKSALVATFLDRHRDEVRVLRGFCDDLSTPQPFGPFWDVAREDLSLVTVLEKGDRRGVMEGVIELLSSRLRPTVVVVEDTQWLDDASLDTITFVGRRIGATNGILLLTYRDAEVDYGHPLRRAIGMMSPSDIIRIRLDRLSGEAVAELVGDSDVDLERLVELSGGNPLLVSELSAAGLDEVPSSVQDSVLARASKLSSSARQTLDLISVVPGGVERDLISELADVSEEDLAESARLDLLQVGSRWVGFKHEITRRAMEAALDAEPRKLLNEHVMEALIDAGADLSRVVHHARQAGAVEAIVEFAPRAAAVATDNGSHREALGHFRALEPYLHMIDQSERGAVVDDWARCALFLDNIEALEVVKMAIEVHRNSGDPMALARGLTLATRSFEVRSRPELADDATAEALSILEGEPRSAVYAFALAQRGWLSMMRGDCDRAIEFAERALEMADEVGDDLTTIHALNTVGCSRHQLGEDGGLASLEEAWRRAADAEYRFEEARALFNLASATFDALDFTRSADYAQRALSTATSYEIDALEAVVQSLYARTLAQKGEWTQAEDLAYGLLDSLPLAAIPSMILIGKLQARMGRPGAKAQLFEAWKHALESGEIQHTGPAAAALAEYGWLTDSLDAELIARLGEVMHEVADKGLSREAGEIALWLSRAGKLESVPDDIAEPYRLMLERQVEEAVAKWRELDSPYEVAVSMMAGAHAQQLEALEILEQLGATAVAARHRSHMRKAGLSVPRGKSRETRANPAGLTARQAEVLELVAKELTNTEIADQLFLSLRTVENHVSAVLSKLGASSREEASAIGRETGLFSVQTGFGDQSQVSRTSSTEVKR